MGSYKKALRRENCKNLAIESLKAAAASGEYIYLPYAGKEVRVRLAPAGLRDPREGRKFLLYLAFGDKDELFVAVYHNAEGMLYLVATAG